MLETLIRLYTMAMAYDVRSPMPHLVGPAGCGKSTTVETLADLVGKELHILNVSRLSPLEIEGVQMPHTNGEELVLKMLPATFWTGLKEGDILLMDELLRGFPEVYSGLLDIFTSRRVGSYRLPKVFIIGASNSVVAYDQALEDRLLHIPVTDPRRSNPERLRLGRILVDSIGLLPLMASSTEMRELLDAEVLPMFDLLDSFKKKGTKSFGTTEGTSIRNLIGQAQLRHIQCSTLKDLLIENNASAMGQKKPQYVVLFSGEKSKVPAGYVEQALKIKDSSQLSDLQKLNISMNLQLVELEAARVDTATVDDHINIEEDPF